MKILVAKTAGFCFGVDKAVNKVEELIDNRKTLKPIYTYGPIIHNPQVVSSFETKGVIVIDELEKINSYDKGTIVIRSHGITEREVNIMKKSGFNISDSTCPYVKKIHKIVKRDSEAGYEIIIIGNKHHPEIKGIAGWSLTKVHFIQHLEDVDNITINTKTRYSTVAQTTFNTELYKEILNKLQNKSFHVIINETICQATKDRQIEAKELSEKVTKMIVIGGRNSSNTRKLFEICKDQCKDTYYIETIEDLALNVFTVNDTIGITAGASTPNNIIEEVISYVRNVKF